MRWIGHAGLAIDRPGGAPDRECLDRALALAPDMLEVDVAACAGGVLALVHDEVLDGGVPVSALELPALRLALPGVLTLDEAVEHLGGRLPLLLDLKGRDVVEPLGTWLRVRDDAADLTVCTDDVAALLQLRHRAPAAARWRTLPSTRSGTRGEGRRRALAVALRSRLGARVGRLADEVRACGLSVDHLALTPGLCAAAHRCGLVVAAWTVNSGRALRSATRSGADYITSDRLADQRV
jgi:glycerophosphoryl diester phosphodiesterase